MIQSRLSWQVGGGLAFGKAGSSVPNPVVTAVIPSDYALARLESLENLIPPTKHQNRKQVLMVLLEDFLKRDVTTATPQDIVLFALDNERGGNTQYHVMGCPHLGFAKSGNRIVVDCDKESCPDFENCPHGFSRLGVTRCPIRRSPESLKTWLSQVKMGLHSLGLDRRWVQGVSNQENPVDSSLVELHIVRIQEEARLSLVSAVQADPIEPEVGSLIMKQVWARIQDMLDKRHLCESGSILRLRLYYAFWLLCLLSGKRPGDLLHLVPQSVLWLPDQSGVMFAMHTHKTAKSTGVVLRWALQRNEFPHMDIVEALQGLEREARFVGWDLASSPLLFPDVRDKAGTFSAKKPGVLSVCNKLFKEECERAGVSTSLTLQGARVGAAIANRVDDDKLLLSTLTGGGWSSTAMAERYSALAVIIKEGMTGNAGDLLKWKTAGVLNAFFRVVSQ